jgi:lysozyme
MDELKLQAGLSAREGNLAYVYDDATGNPIIKGYTVIGNPTIGIGRLLTKEKGLSNAERQLLLSNDITGAVADAEGEPWWPVVANDDVRSRAMVELVFNLGLGKLRGFVNALSALGNGDFAGAAAGFMDSDWAREVGNRAAILTQMIATGNDP